MRDPSTTHGRAITSFYVARRQCVNLNILDQVYYKCNKHSKQEDSRMSKKSKNNNEWIYLPYVDKERKFIKKKLFRNTNINRSYKTKSTIEKNFLLPHNRNISTNIMRIA
jgi:hypothetical protein